MYNRKTKYRMLSRFPYSAVSFGKNPNYLSVPPGISFRNWRRGLEERWGEIETLDLTDEKKEVVEEWLKENEVEYTKLTRRSKVYHLSRANANWAALALKGNTWDQEED